MALNSKYLAGKRKSIFSSIADNSYQASVKRIDTAMNYAASAQDRSYIPLSNPPIEEPIQAFRLIFNDIEAVDAIVGDSSNLQDWNTFFDLPTYGNPFTSVTVIGNEVQLFGGSNIVVKEELFSSPLGLSLVSIDDTLGSVIELQYNAFGDESGNGYCPLLETVYFVGLTTITDSFCFYGASSLTYFSAPNLVTLAGDACFEDCTSLTEVYIPLCTDLGGDSGYNWVFDGVTGNVINLTIPESLMTIKGGEPDDDILVLGIQNTAIINGSYYQAITGYIGNLTLTWNDIANANLLVGNAYYVNNWNSLFKLSSSPDKFTSVNVVGNSVTLIGGKNIYIPSNLFSNNPNIISVSDTGCVAYLGGGCFSSCDSLTTVNFPAVTSEKVENVPGFNGAAFYSNASLTAASVPQLSIVAGSMFRDCPVLTFVDISSATVIRDTVFGQSSALSSVIMPNVISIGEQAFRLTNITTLNLANLTTIAGSAFQGCDLLTSINLPSCASIGGGCFSYCTGLTNISLPSCTNLGGSVTNDNVFYNIVGKTISLTVPSALMTCNSGNADGDISYLQSSNTVTVTTV